MLLGGLFVFTSFHNLEELWLSFAFCLCLYGYIILMCMLCFMVWTFIFWTISSSREIELAKFILFCTTALNSFHYLRPFSLASEGNVFLQSQLVHHSFSFYDLLYKRRRKEKSEYIFCRFLEFKTRMKKSRLNYKIFALTFMISWIFSLFLKFCRFCSFVK